MTVLGALVLGLSLVGLVLRKPPVLAVAVGIGAAFPSSAATTVGQTVPLFTAATLVAVLGIGIERRPVRSAGYTLLVAFGVWAVVVTLLAPWAFAGVPTLSPREGIDAQIGAPSPLAFTVSNLAQALYVVTGLLATLFLLRSGTTRLAVLTAAWTGTAVSFVRGVLKVAGTDPLRPLIDTLDVTYSSAGDVRWRGVFSEPSTFAGFTLAVLVLALVSAWTAPSGRARVAMVWLAVLSVVDLAASGSGTAVLATAIVGGVGLVAILVRYVLGGGRGTPWIVLGTLAAVTLVLTVGGELVAPALEVASAKVGSNSQTARSGADAIGLQLVRETLGFGAGLGSNRSSSFAVTLLSTTGVVGGALFTAAVAAMTTRALRVRRTMPLAAGLVALLVAMVVALPDLSSPLLWLLLAGCVAATTAPVGQDVAATTAPAGPDVTARTPLAPADCLPLPSPEGVVGR